MRRTCPTTPTAKIAAVVLYWHQELRTPLSALTPGPRTPPGPPPPTPDIMNMVPVTPPELLGSPPRTPELQ